MTWMWVVAFGLMFVSAMIPPIVDGDATILDMDDTLSIVCYWVIPYTVLGIAGADLRDLPALVRQEVGRGRQALRGAAGRRRRSRRRRRTGPPGR